MIRWLFAHALIAVVVLGAPTLLYDNRNNPVLVTAFGFVFLVLSILTAIVARPFYWPAPVPARQPTAHERRAAKVRENGGHYTQAEWKALCQKYGYRCLCCGRKRPLTADHIVPVEHGGSSDISNIQPLCRSCNSAKGTRTIDYRKATG